MVYALIVGCIVLIGIGVGFWFAEPVAAPTVDTEGTEVAVPADEQSASREAVVPSGRTIEVYRGVAVALNARELDLSNRGLDGSLMAEVRQLAQLEVLDLSGNSFTGLPAEIGQLQKLRVLNLANNQFSGLPLELGNLQNLEVLDVRGNANIATVDLEQIIGKLPPSVTVLR